MGRDVERERVSREKVQTKHHVSRSTKGKLSKLWRSDDTYLSFNQLRSERERWEGGVEMDRGVKLGGDGCP